MVKDFLKNAYKTGKGAIKGILNEYGISDDKHEDLLRKLDNEINIDIENSNKQAQSQAINMGVPFEKYENERDAKDECLKKLKEIKKKNIPIEITKEESELLTKLSAGFIDPKGVYDLECYDVFSSLVKKGVLKTIKSVYPNTKYNDLVYMQHNFNVKIKDDEGVKND